VSDLGASEVAVRDRWLTQVVGSVLRVIGVLGDLVEDIAVRLHGPVNVASDTEAVIRRRRGGSAANTAVAVCRAGGRARFIGQIGDDAIGTGLVAELQSEGVEPLVRRGGRTGTIVVLVDHLGERTMLTDRGACADLADPQPAWLDGLKVLHVPAYSLIGGATAQTAVTLVNWAHDLGMIVSIDASSAAVIEAYGAPKMRNLLWSLQPHVLLCNELEAAALSKAGGVDGIATAATVVKQGADPALVSVPGEGVVEVPVPPLAGVTDTTGAGDAFAAGFLLAVSTGSLAAEAAATGHRTARAAIEAVSA
jgi:sugar/nucleoside kinase (ribokinase family)